MSDDLIKRSDAINAINKALDRETLLYGLVRKIAVDAIRSTPSADRPNEVIYGNEHNCIMTIFGKCSYAETGCGDCAVVEKVRKALSTDIPTWIPCSERMPEKDGYYLVSLAFEWGNEIEMGWLLDREWVNSNSHVTVAWMPLPEPWKGADDE